MQLSKNFMTPEGRKRKVERQENQLSFKQKIDQVLRHDFQQLRQGKMDYSQYLQSRNNNAVFLQYIKAIYNEYNIPDPLGQINLSYLSSSPSAIKTIKKQKLHLMSNYTLKYSTTPKNVSSIPSEYPLNASQLDAFRNGEEMKERRHLDSTFYQRLQKLALEGRQNQSLSDLLSRFKIQESDNEQESGKQYKNKPEMYIQQETKIGIPDQDQDYASPANFSLFCSNISKQKILKECSDKEEGLQQNFRYCVGCEKPVLEPNKQYHETACRQFQIILSMPEDDTINYLSKKVEKMKVKVEKILKEIQSEEISKFKQASSILTEEAKRVLQTGVISDKFRKEYFKSLEIGRKWCLISEQINKIHWFLRIIAQRQFSASQK